MDEPLSWNNPNSLKMNVLTLPRELIPALDHTSSIMFASTRSRFRQARRTDAARDCRSLPRCARQINDFKKMKSSTLMCVSGLAVPHTAAAFDFHI
jgi:hypothetical protein